MSKFLISSIANSPKINKVLMQRLHKRVVFLKQVTTQNNMQPAGKSQNEPEEPLAT